MANQATQRVRAAITNTVKATNLGNHWSGLLESRAGLAQPVGSFIPDVDVETLARLLNEVEWQEYEHEAIGGGAQGFVSRGLTGKVGLVALSTLPPETPVKFADGHETGFLEVVVVGGQSIDVDYTVLLIGPNDGPENPEIVWTFHPGAPIRPSSLKAEATVGSETTAAEAIKLGFDYAKIGS